MRLERFIIKYGLLPLPLLGILIGHAYAYASYHAILESWQMIGQPGERIVQILGTRVYTNGRKILVETGSGGIYSILFFDHGKVDLKPQLAWEREADGTVEHLPPLHYYGADFYSRRPPFQAGELFLYEYIYRVEGKGEAKFALDPEGNLWIWEHQIAGLTGLVFTFFR